MIHLAKTAVSPLRIAEQRAKSKAEHGLLGAIYMIAAGGLLFGVLVFASIGVLLVLAKPLGMGVAARVVALLWAPLAGCAVSIAVRHEARLDRAVLPRNSADRLIGAASADFGENSPIIAVAALVASMIASQQRG